MLQHVKGTGELSVDFHVGAGGPLKSGKDLLFFKFFFFKDFIHF